MQVQDREGSNVFFTSTVVGSSTSSRLISGSTSGTVVVLTIDSHISDQFTVTTLQYLLSYWFP